MRKMIERRNHHSMMIRCAPACTPLVAVLVAVIFAIFIAPATTADDKPYHVDVVVEGLSDNAQTGQRMFNQTCASCHGLNAEGSEAGPPLIHSIYNAGHHSNKAFYRAVTQGSRQHHWSFGDMPPQPTVGFTQMTFILAFIREVQVVNDI
ncbi:c-type cytochrome [Saccharospirillum impatiens]|jgi:mono/diheme cytochrome c family protein|uniref:c-type cytochrome n=1 Tax=Saccharospirillum impatiens TaxID=169438 RepID=UPI0006863963|nr:c-type cytochrome [Saccharospirillum impatiens]